LTCFRVDISHIQLLRQIKRGASPSFFFFPLSFEGEGDTGGEVDKLPFSIAE
jgi:hypothetical protein